MATETSDHRFSELQSFMESGVGVKELVDSGLAGKVPEIFIDPPESSPSNGSHHDDDLRVPVIDFSAVDGDGRAEIVGQVRAVMGTWGLFQIVNHGVPATVLQEMIEGVRRFQEEQPAEEKKEWYKRGGSGQATYDKYAEKFTAALWRDSFACYLDDGMPNQEAVPQVCSAAINEYMKSMVQLKERISEVASEALGLKCDHLSKIKCMVSAYLLCHYYPPCPEPERVTGTGAHTDPGFLTLLLQDNIGGLQVLHHDHWVDVPFVPNSIILNFGDLMQLVTNDRAKSARHRVLNKRAGPRISVACFFSTPSACNDELLGPIEELVTDESPAIYKPTTPNHYFSYFRANGQRENHLPHFKLAP